MTRLIRLAFLFALVALTSCGERDQDKKRRLKGEVIEIQGKSLRAILKNDFKFMNSFDEEERLFAKIRSDLERCREIEAELEGLESDDIIATIRQNTDDLLESIAQREERTRQVRIQIQETRDNRPTMDQKEMVEALRDSIAFREEHGLDTSEIRSLLAAHESSEVRSNDLPALPKASMSKAQLEAAIVALDQSIHSLKAEGGDTSPVEEARDRLLEHKKALLVNGSARSTSPAVMLSKNSTAVSAPGSFTNAPKKNAATEPTKKDGSLTTPRSKSPARNLKNHP